MFSSPCLFNGSQPKKGGGQERLMIPPLKTNDKSHFAGVISSWTRQTSLECTIRIFHGETKR